MFISPSDKNFINSNLVPMPNNYYGLLTGEAEPKVQQSPGQGAAPSGYGSMYDQLFAANPYRQQTYNQSGWQKFLGSLGFRTGYDDWLDQTSTQIAEYDAAIFSQMQQDQFNSPAAMAQREKQAGMNPDLLGIGDVAQAAGPAEDVNGMQPQESNDAAQAASLVGGFIRGIYSAFSVGMSLYKDTLAVKDMQNVIDNGNITKAKSMIDLADEAIVGAYSRYGQTDADRTAAEADMIANSDMLIPSGLSRSARRDFRSYLMQRLKSLKNDAKVREYYLNRAKAIEGANRAEASGFIPSPEDFEGEVEDAFIQSLAETARDVQKQQASNLLASANVEEGEIVNRGIAANIETQHLDELNDANFGAALAQSESSEVANKTSLNAYQKIVNDNKTKFYAAMKTLSDMGNPVARVVMMQLALQDLAQFEVSGSLDFNLLKGLSSLVNGSTGEFSEGLKKSNGFGLSGEIRVKTK